MNQIDDEYALSTAGLPMTMGDDVIVEPSALTDRVQVIRKKDPPSEKKKKILVAAYCRVSTDREEQEKSLELQMASYKQIILEHPDWELAGIYADSGITGTSVKKRKEFMRMIEDAKEGKINRILAKSISRFARNTEDMLKYTRMLKSIGVGVYFEKEHLDTLQITSEILLTVYAAFSQEESHDISEAEKTNLRWRAKQGIVRFSKLYGYTSTKEEKWIIVPQEAAMVRKIFERYAKGFTAQEIVMSMKNQKIPSPKNSKNGWSVSMIEKMLRNEKYVGDCLTQKTYIEDHLTHRQVSNRDMILPQYYIPNNHIPIVSRELFKEVQLILQLRGKSCGISLYPYYGFLVCPKCGAKLLACSLNIISSPRVWFCPGKDQRGTMTRRERSDCPPFVLFESLLNEVMIQAIQNLGEDDCDSEMRKRLPFIRRRIRKKGTIERYYLKKLVRQITLSDFQSVKIVWKTGRQSILKLNIPKLKMYPLPDIDQIIEQNTSHTGFVMSRNNVELIRKGVERRTEFIQNVIIEKENDDFIPTVKKEKNSSKSGPKSGYRKELPMLNDGRKGEGIKYADNENQE